MSSTGQGDGETDASRPAYRLGETAAIADLTIEETFELLESEAGEALPELSADVLGSIVRGYVDQIVRTRGVTRRRSAGRLVQPRQPPGGAAPHQPRRDRQPATG